MGEATAVEPQSRNRKTVSEVVDKTRGWAGELSKAATGATARVKSASTRKVISWRDAHSIEARDLISRSLASSRVLRQRTKRALVDRLQPMYESSTSKVSSGRDQALMFAQAILATDFSSEINRWLNQLVESTPTVYDKAMDAVYNANHVGGGHHRLFDGGHSILGAIKASHGAAHSDSIIQEATGTVSAILKDLTTPMGLPAFTWSKDAYDTVANTLDSAFHIPKSWFFDLNTFTSAELIAGSIGVAGFAFHWKRGDTRAFARLVGSTGLLSVISANPALGVITIAALAKSFADARGEGDYSDFVEGLAKGGITTGAFLVAFSAAGGPVVIPILAGTCAGILAHKATDKVSVSSIGDYLGESFNAAIDRARRGTTSVISPRTSG